MMDIRDKPSLQVERRGERTLRFSVKSGNHMITWIATVIFLSSVIRNFVIIFFYHA